MKENSTFDIIALIRMASNFLDKLSLPSANPNEDLEIVSRNKLEALFDESLFTFRNEIPDKGIDTIVEIKRDGKFTGYRFAIQLKAANNIKHRDDGAWCVSVQVSNINYLRNISMCTYYILYNKAKNEFYYEDTNNVYQNLIKRYQNKKLPESFSIKFFKRLDSESINGIYQSVLNYGMLHTRIKAHSFPDAAPLMTKGMLIDDDNEVYSVEQNIGFIKF